ncbi:hypothetical protein [Bacillus phage phiAGATE]|uniref:Uncharacterized protein n=1 Tax=Bacillus phage phiAGATE TaxID=1204533 RepID=L0L8H3_9CAUD|nr:hypothetical protein G380_gp069 [Bacillus phage phiAGATE]AGB62719.1 hypothetical protein [Bacillus phage phiAGATE]
MVKIKETRLLNATLMKLRNFEENDKLKLYGVSYTNPFLSRRVACRSHALVNKLDITNSQVNLTLSMLIEKNARFELDNTLDFLVRYEAGDIPGYEQSEENPDFLDNSPQQPITATYHLADASLVLNMKNPTVQYREFTIQKEKFTILYLTERFDEVIDHTVALLYGTSGALKFLGNFLDKELTMVGFAPLFELMSDDNLLGTHIVSLKVESKKEGLRSVCVPIEGVVSLMENMEGDYIFSTDQHYFKLPYASLQDYRMTVDAVTGGYILKLDSTHNSIELNVVM